MIECFFIAYKTVLHVINSYILLSTNPCNNKAIHVLLMHKYLTLNNNFVFSGVVTKIDIINSNMPKQSRHKNLSLTVTCIEENII